MKNVRLRNSIAYLFLVLFLSMKMVGLHVLSHTNDNHHALHCTVCDHAIAHNLTPAITPDLQDFNIETTDFFVRTELIKSYDYIISSTIATDQLFSRPPPPLL